MLELNLSDHFRLDLDFRANIDFESGSYSKLARNANIISHLINDLLADTEA